MIVSIIGWVGSFLLTFCGVPMALHSYKDGHSNGIDMTFLQMWFWGEVGVLILVLAQDVLLYPLVANYSFNIVLILIILKYKIYPRITPPCKD